MKWNLKRERESRIGRCGGGANAHTQDRLSISKESGTSHPVVWVTMHLSGGSCHGYIRKPDVGSSTIKSDKIKREDGEREKASDEYCSSPTSAVLHMAV